MELPDWFVLLNEWPSSGLGERGVTLPFLVGALAIKDQREPDPESARSLVEKIAAQVPEDFVIEGGWCSNLGAPIFAATSVSCESRSTSELGIQHPSENRLSLVFGDDLQAHWNLYDSHRIEEALIKDAEDPIRDHRYSRSRNGYELFRSGELSFIKSSGEITSY